MNDIPRALGPDASAQAPPRVVKAKASHWQIPTVGMILLLACGGAVWWQLQAVAPVQYQTLPVSRGAILRAVTANGSVNPIIVVQVGTYVSGVIQARYCDYNTKVKKGQLCAKIDPRPYQIIVDQDTANLAIAHAQLDKDTANQTYTKLTFERNQQLSKTQATSQDAVDLARSAYNQAEAQVALDQATILLREAELKAAQINLDYTDIRSPVDGTVVSRNVEMGQTVAASFQTPTLFLIATDLTKMQVDTNISESDIGAIKISDKSSFTVESFPRRPFEGDVSEIRQAPQTIQNVVTYDVVVSAPNPDLALKPGMTATVHLETDRRDDALRVPDQALRYVPQGLATMLESPTEPIGSPHVYVLRDGRPTAVVLTTGLDDDTFTEVIKGDIQAGDELIIGESVSHSAAATPSSAPRAPRL
jgi:HlyD family secretion protein